jgi:hypothetical protein
MADVHQAERALRDLHWNPQRHLEQSVGAEAQALAQQKQALIEQSPETRQERVSRFQELRRVSDRLRSLVRSQEEAARARLEERRGDLKLREVLRRRDYAFCLYPEQELRTFLTSFLK